MTNADKQLNKIKKHLSSDKFKKNRAVLRSISGNVRYKIVEALHQAEDGLTVGDIAKLFDYSISRVSHQLRVLRKYKISIQNK